MRFWVTTCVALVASTAFADAGKKCVEHPKPSTNDLGLRVETEVPKFESVPLCKETEAGAVCRAFSFFTRDADDPLLRLIAEEAKDHPGVELHIRGEMNDEDTAAIADERAQRVRVVLLEVGVASAQIKIRKPQRIRASANVGRLPGDTIGAVVTLVGDVTVANTGRMMAVDPDRTIIPRAKD